MRGNDMNTTLKVLAGFVAGVFVFLGIRQAWRDGQKNEKEQDRVDEESEDSFPASDPPSSSGAHA
jgi:hypothetical protein